MFLTLSILLTQAAPGDPKLQELLSLPFRLAKGKETNYALSVLSVKVVLFFRLVQ